MGHCPGQPIIPSPSQPLGVPFPGQEGGLWNEPNSPNWVGHFITKYRPGPKYLPDSSEDSAFLESPLLVYDYAIGGNTVAGVAGAQMNAFLEGAGSKPDWAPWTSEDSLFGLSLCFLLRMGPLK